MSAEPPSALEHQLVTIAETWAREVAGAPVVVAQPAELLTEVVVRVKDRPLLVIWPCLARWRRELATAALADLDSGCDLVLGPTVDGDLYLLGLADEVPAALGQLDVSDEDAVSVGARVAVEAGIEIGLLRAERPLRSAGDVAAALADPLTPPELLAWLSQHPAVGSV